MNNPSEKLRNMRLDLSPYLFHFTDSLETLFVILGECCLKSEKGYICFTETPLCMMLPMLDYMSKTKKPILGKYGIGFKRDALIEKHGARPVMYCDILEQFDIGQDIHWLYEELDVKKHDFQWLREWRIKDEFDFSKVDRNDMVVVVEKQKDIELCGYYVDNIRPYYDDDGKLFDADFDIKRLYRCIALDELQNKIKEDVVGDYELMAIIEKEKLDEIIEM